MTGNVILNETKVIEEFVFPVSVQQWGTSLLFRTILH